MKRQGITFTEVVVVISIVGILMALLIPAVMWARESSRRAECSSNLRQLALAVQSYETLHRKMPPLWQGKNWSVVVVLLPQLENEEMLRQVNLWTELGMNGGNLGKQSLPVLHCPSDGESMAHIDALGCATNYVANMGVKNVQSGYNGALRPPHVSTWFPQFPVGQITAGAITDGLSGTALFAEVLAGRRESSDFRRSSMMTERSFETAEYDDFCAACRNHEWRLNADGTLVQSGWRGRIWTAGWPAGIYTHDMQPNEPSCLGLSIGAFSTASAHPGGIQVAFCDGHVQFISQSVNQRVWRAFGSRDGSEVLSVP